MKITISKENYLKAIAEAESEGESVKASTLARWLAVSPPAVTMAVRRLKRDALIHVAADGQVTLTAAGREIAQRLLSRHHLIERMLSEIFGMEWYRVHDEAEQLEHAVSAAFEHRLIEKLGRGGICPHGNPMLAETPADRRARGLRQLHEADRGPWRVESVFERDRGLLERLDRLGIRPGATVGVLSNHASGALALEVEGRQVELDRREAGRIWCAPPSVLSPKSGAEVPHRMAP